MWKRGGGMILSRKYRERMEPEWDRRGKCIRKWGQKVDTRTRKGQ